MSVLSKEQWKPVKYKGIDYTGLYEISNIGRIRKIEYFGIVYLSQEPRCRRIVTLSNGGRKAKSALVSHLVVLAFAGDIPKGYVIDHINNIPYDDRICNLQRITRGENNSKDHYGKKLAKLTGVPVGISFNSRKTAYKATVTLPDNNNFHGGGLYLGLYRTIQDAISMLEKAQQIVKEFNSDDNGELRTVIQDAIKDFRSAKKLKPVNFMRKTRSFKPKMCV